MNPLDWFFALILAWSILRALQRGLFRELFALAGLLAGLVLACLRYHSVAWRLSAWLPSPPVAQACAFLLLLIGTMLLATFVGRLLQRALSAVGLGLLDRLAGALFGAARGALLALAILLALTAFLPAAAPWNNWLQTSLLTPYLLRAVHAVSFVMPNELQTRLAEGFQLLKHTAPVWIKLPSAPHNSF